MDSILAKPLSGEELFWMLLVLCLTAGTFARIFIGYRHRAQQREIDASLKMEMIERGMSADEIERVLRAKSPDGKAPSVSCETKQHV